MEPKEIILQNRNFHSRDVDEAPIITDPDLEVTEDSGSYSLTGTVSIVDPEGETATIVSIDTTEAQYGTFSFNTATGKYSYVLNNDNDDVHF